MVVLVKLFPIKCALKIEVRLDMKQICKVLYLDGDKFNLACKSYVFISLSSQNEFD